MKNNYQFSQRFQRKGVIHSALVSINDALEQSIFAERTSRLDGLLQRLDPRLKLIGMLVLLVVVNLVRQPIVIAANYLLSVILAAASNVSLLVFIKRVWVTVFIFTALIALPALFITPGEVLWQITPVVAVTRTGTLSALLLLLRASTSVSLAALLVLSTSWNNILKAMGVLHLPDVIILTLGMTYRYIHLLLHTTNDMFLSRQSRILRPQTSAESRRLLAATSGGVAK